MISEPLKKIIHGNMDNAQLSDIETAEVVGVNPVKIKLSDLADPLVGEFLIVPERLIKDTYEVEIPQLTFNGPIIVKNVVLKVGDQVTLLKAKGGQKYFVLDKVV